MTDPDDSIMGSDDYSEIESNEYGANREQVENLSSLNSSAHSYFPHDHLYANGKIIVLLISIYFGVRLEILASKIRNLYAIIFCREWIRCFCHSARRPN
jgi:hypothetical protein